jgi:hypothetical protein
MTAETRVLCRIRRSRAAVVMSAVLLAGCAAGPAFPPAGSTAGFPLVDQSGLVIGTLSYHYTDVETPVSEDVWVVHFERLDSQDAGQGYALAVSVNATRQAGVFAGALPAGVYAFRTAACADRPYAAGRISMPFEVQAGEVRDVGHYAVSAALSP